MPTKSSNRAYPQDLANEVTQSLPDSGWKYAEVSIPSFGSKPFEVERGEQLGCFEIVCPLGRGGMGEVYLATDRRLGRRVALKLLPGRFQGDEARSRLQQEARATSSLNHPNILTVYEVGECAGRPFIASEFIDGITLREHLKRKRLGTSEILDIAIQGASALGAAHSAGIVHRDIKPENIMVRPDGYVKVLDFGLAQMASPVIEGFKILSIDRFGAGGVVGSAAYMSPEQAQGMPLDSRSDIFSFGAVLYEMVAGKSPFRGPSRTSTLDSVIHQTPASICAVSDGHSGLEHVISRCLEKDADLRYQSIDHVKRELEKVRQQQDPCRHKRLLTAAIILMSALGVGAICGSMQAPAHHANPARAVPFTTLPGGEYEPAFSPDGNRIAFVWNGEREDNFDIYVKPLGSENLTRLTRDPAGEGSPTWSPDGRKIAFLRYLGKPGKSAVYTISSHGGREAKLAEIFPREHIFDRQLDWSPDGKTLALVDKELVSQPFSVYLLDVATAKKRKLSGADAAAERDSGPAFSPDGRQLAFMRANGTGVAKLYVVSVKNGGEKEIPFQSTLLSGHAWSADGKSLIVAAERDGNRGVWRVPLAGGSPPELILAAKANFIAVARSSNRIAYSQWFADTNIWRRPVGKSGAVEARAVEIAASTLEERSPQYSPDGSRIAFRSDRSGSKEIWMSDPNGHNAVQLTNFNGPLTGSPRWSPDGTHIVFDSRPGGHGGIFSICVDTRELRTITSNRGDDALPYWSGDGRWIYFASTRSGSWQVWKTPANGPERDARPITGQGGFAPQESADGKFVYYAKGRDEHAGLWRVPADEGTEELVTADLKPGYWGYWTIRPDAIYYLEPDGSGHASFSRFDLATKRTQRHLGLFADPPFGDSGISMSPDAKWLLYTQVDRSGSDIWIVSAAGI